MYTNLAKRGMVIYPGKVTKADCFRVGTIGRLFPFDMNVRQFCNVLRVVALPHTARGTASGHGH